MSTTTNVAIVDAATPAGGAGRAETGSAASGPSKPKRPPRPAKLTWRTALKRDWRLYSLLVLPLVFLLVFRYLPMAGNIIAFRRYRPGGNIFGDEWVGFHYFEMFINDPTFWRVFTNTIILGALCLVLIFPLPIILALMLNELRSAKFKRIAQSISYLPHFMSVVIVAGMVLQLVSTRGTVNQIVDALGGTPIDFIQKPEWFRPIFVSSEVWQTVGWGTILYLAALTTIDPQLYEAARIDGAGRWKQTWHVTLPGIAPTIVVLLILNIGTFLSVSFEKVLLLYNPLNLSSADIIATYLYRVGIGSGSFSYATAVGLFEALIGLFLVLSANLISRRVTGASLW
ncbi:sugar ABC transporter permease [Agromyces intestinalis]|uniref:Sugar ABC transporter permease n=1 Tax=Agromyces intestinalis TaxID=2592652 RepID=A0A5C1YGC1_9MICO|nr:ABC transporter permease subunit [Agromyces intestinalis]QEO14470.1 sugar ABC transporter permease [Agromyces intestinalis]